MLEDELERLEDGSDPQLLRVEEAIRDTYEVILMKLKLGDQFKFGDKR